MAEYAAALARQLEYRFRDHSLLQMALTHRSAGAGHNERLEFLGDAVLNCVAADIVYRLRPRADEGDLSRLRAHLVRESSLAAIAAQLALGDFLLLGPGETGGHRRQSVLADALEAVIGAVYLDGGMAAAETVIRKLYDPALQVLPEGESLKDAKTRLQEFLQGRSLPLPQYELLSLTGPQHRQVFTVSCQLAEPDRRCEGRGSSRRRAEQEAASLMLGMIQKTSQS